MSAGSPARRLRVMRSWKILIELEMALSRPGGVSLSSADENNELEYSFACCFRYRNRPSSS